MNSELTPFLWPASRLGEALLTLAQVKDKKLHTPQWDPDWLEAAARSLGLEAQPVEIPYADFERHLPKIGPAILHVPTNADDAFLVILPGLIVLTPHREKIRIAPSAWVPRIATIASWPRPRWTALPV